MFRALAVLLFLILTPLVHASEWVYVVTKGDTLWGFSERNLKNVDRWKDLQRINAIENPKRLLPGQLVRVPLHWVKSVPVSASVIQIQGEATLTDADGNHQPVSQGSKVDLGDRLDVGNQSSLTIEFADGSRITLYEHSQVLFNHLNQYGQSGMVDTRIRLDTGRSDTKAKPAVGKGSRFEIQTPSAITAVRGTEFRTTVKDEDGVSRIEVLEGRVAVKAKGIQRSVSQGYGTRVDPGKTPLKVRELLSAPEFQNADDPVRSTTFTVRWDAPSGAQKYRAELADNEQFETLLMDRELRQSKTFLPDLADGDYFLRVRAIDSAGIEGHSAVARLVMDTHPRAPLLLSPHQNQRYRGVSPDLKWSKPLGIDQFRLQVSKQESFEQVLVDEIRSSSRYSTSNLSKDGAGYFWRVASISASAEEGPFSQSRYFQLRPEPAIQLEDVVVKETHISIGWEEIDDDSLSYQVQISEEDAFDVLLDDQTVSGASILLDKESDFIRYARIRAVGEDGFTGPWSVTQRIYPEQNGVLKWFGIGLLGIFLL